MTSLDFIPAISCLQSYKAFFQLPELSCKGLQSNTRLFIKKKRSNRGFPSVKTFQIPAEPCPQPSRTFVQTFRNFLMSKLPNPFRNPLPAMQRLPKHCRTFQNLRTPCKILQTASNLQLPQTSASGTPRTSAQTFQLPEPSTPYAKNPKTYCRFLTTFLESSQNLDAASSILKHRLEQKRHGHWGHWAPHTSSRSFSPVTTGRRAKCSVGMKI